MGRHRTQEATDAFQSLIDYLKERKADIYVEKETASLLSSNSVHIVSSTELGQMVDLVIVVGGDGSLLQAARCVVDDDTPVIGINRGRLGFLTDIKPKNLSKELDAILDGHYITEQRFLLQASVEEQKLSPCAALNDVVLASGDTAHMMEFEVYINDQFLCSERSDGMIIATPTGSTAYALSGGGPILQPSLDAIVLVPMFSHTLNSRPIVVPGNSEITIIIGERIVSLPRISADGEAYCELKPGQHVNISKKTKQLNLIHPEHYDYFANVRSKLHWGQKLTREDA